MLLDHLKSFYHKYFLKITLALCVALIAVFGTIIWIGDKPVKDVEIFIPDIKNGKESNIKENTVEFLTTKTNDQSSTIEKNTKDSQLDNDYLIDLYQKIDSLNEQVVALQQEILSLKKNQKINLQSDNVLSTVLIELYRIQNIALLGEDFSGKIPSLLAITKNYPSIQENLFILKSMEQLPEYDKIEKLLVEVENSILKEKAERKFQEDQKISSRVKLNLWDYIKIKKVKNLSVEDPLLKIKNIRTSINNGNYKQAYNVATKLSETYSVAEGLTKELEAFYHFSNTLDNLFTIILDQE